MQILILGRGLRFFILNKQPDDHVDTSEQASGEGRARGPRSKVGKTCPTSLGHLRAKRNLRWVKSLRFGGLFAISA